jgi:hypothetical protein
VRLSELEVVGVSSTPNLYISILHWYPPLEPVLADTEPLLLASSALIAFSDIVSP